MTSSFILLAPFISIIMITCVLIQRKHLLMALLALEGTILGLVVMTMTLNHSQWAMLILVMLTFGACGASLGLACMVSMSRSYGNDHITSLSSNKC